MKKVAPTAMIQPKDVEAEIKPPDPNEPEEDYGDDSGEGVEGGVVGGVVGGQVSKGGGYEDAPQVHGRRVQGSQDGRQGLLPGQLPHPARALRVRHLGDRQVRRVPQRRRGSLLGDGQVPDQRIADAIRNALANCTWIPGSDAQGRPTPIYVILPVRLQ